MSWQSSGSSHLCYDCDKMCCGLLKVQSLSLLNAKHSTVPVYCKLPICVKALRMNSTDRFEMLYAVTCDLIWSVVCFFSYG